MEGDGQKVPVAQEVKPEVKGVSQTPPQPPADSQTPLPPAGQVPSGNLVGGSAPPEKPKRSKKKKIVIGFILMLVLMVVAYGIYLAMSYRNCSKTTPQTCETNTCGFSLTGFESTTETKGDCCGNTKCEVGETSSSCSTDCPSCDDNSECTSDSYDYDGQQCVHEQTFAPCHVRSITLSSVVPEDDYQIKVELTASDFDYSKAKINGEDIRFFDEDDNPLNYWIEDWNSEGGKSSVWVKVVSSETDKIYMYYGHPDASSASAGLGVFEFFEGFDYETEKELTKVWDKHGSPEIELSNSVVTITTSGGEEHGGQYISLNVGADILINNIFEMNLKRFSGGDYANHMANIGNASSLAGPASDAWALLRHNPSPDGGIVVFGSNYGGIASPPVGSFNTIMIYHQDGVSYAYEPAGTKVAQYTWPMGGPSPGRDYILLGGTAYQSGNGKASYDWIRVRKYVSTEPSATLGNEESVGEESAIKEFYSEQ